MNRMIFKDIKGVGNDLLARRQRMYYVRVDLQAHKSDYG
jgi:hypothetical protein